MTYIIFNRNLILSNNNNKQLFFKKSMSSTNAFVNVVLHYATSKFMYCYTSDYIS